jgi:putative spermidine/putrescine transport system ATP-binding protein
MRASLTIRQLTKQFGTNQVLKGINLEIPTGHLVVLLGPSGCGKTTLLRTIAGISDATSGGIWLNDRRIDEVPPERRNFGVVFQTYALFPHLSVARNVAFGLEMRRVSRPEIERRVAAALDVVGLGDYATRLPKQLSGGQQQRVALARAIVIEPNVLLFDEPLSNLDAKLRDSLREDLRALQQKLGITSVYVTHDQSEAMVMSDRIVVMNAGEIDQFGAPREIYERPASARVAAFIGRSNTLGGAIAEALGGESYRIATSSGAIGAEGPAGLPSGTTVQVMIRPENIRIAEAGEENDGDNRIGGTVIASIYQGSANQLSVRLASGDTVTVDVAGRRLIEPGAAIALRFSPRDAWLLAS